MDLDELTIGHFYLVEWTDAAEIQGWRFKDLAMATQPTDVQTVGMLYRMEETFIMMVLNLGDEGTESECVCGTMMIPKCLIRRVKLLSYSDG